jgi:hypothetical protein
MSPWCALRAKAALRSSSLLSCTPFEAAPKSVSYSPANLSHLALALVDLILEQLARNRVFLGDEGLAKLRSYISQCRKGVSVQR